MTTIFNFNKLVPDIDTQANTPDSRDCKDYRYSYPATHLVALLWVISILLIFCLVWLMFLLEI